VFVCLSVNKYTTTSPHQETEEEVEFRLFSSSDLSLVAAALNLGR
jgi:hypothetical protein